MVVVLRGRTSPIERDLRGLIALAELPGMVKIMATPRHNAFITEQTDRLSNFQLLPIILCSVPFPDICIVFRSIEVIHDR